MFGSMSVAVAGLQKNPSSLTAFRAAAEVTGMFGFEPFEYTLYSSRSPGNAADLQPWQLGVDTGLR